MAKKKRSSVYYNKQDSIIDSLSERPIEEVGILEVKENNNSEVVNLGSLLKKEMPQNEGQGEVLDTITIAASKNKPIVANAVEELKLDKISIVSTKDNSKPLETKTLVEESEIFNEDESEEAKIDQTKYEIVDIISIDLCYDKKALTDVNVRNTPEKANNIDRILYKGETITLVTEYDNPIWAKTKDGKYIMKEFLG